MRHQALLGLLAAVLTCAVVAQDELSPDATLASIAHSNGIRGGDLAEELGFERDVDKFTPLAEMGVGAEQVKAALVELGLTEEQAAAALVASPEGPTPSAGIPEEPASGVGGELPPDVTLESIAHSRGVRGGDLAVELGLPREVAKQQPLAEMGITREQLAQALEALGSSLPAAATGEVEFSISMTLPEAAEALGIAGKELAHDVGVPLDKMRPDVPMAELGVTQARLDQAVRHNLAGHESLLPSDWKYPLFALVVLFALLYLLRLGIPKGVDPRKRRTYYPNWPYVVVLLLSVVLLGFTTGKSPNPMEGVVKVFKATVGLYDSVWPYAVAMAFFLALAAVANKAICGWACPFGAVEELLYMLPLFRRAKRLQLPFWVSNTIRAGMFVAFLLMLYGLVGGRKGFVVYHYLNPFNLFNQDFSTPIIWYFIGAYVVISLVFYRPFCRFICPFGFLSWIVERVSLSRVRIDRERCTDCKACAKACPLPAAGDRLAGKALPADCFSCMRCLRVCPVDAIHYRPTWGPASPAGGAEEETEAA